MSYFLAPLFFPDFQVIENKRFNIRESGEQTKVEKMQTELYFQSGKNNRKWENNEYSTEEKKSQPFDECSEREKNSLAIEQKEEEEKHIEEISGQKVIQNLSRMENFAI